MKFDGKSNRGYEFSNLFTSSTPTPLPLPKDLLFKTIQYLKSTLEIVWCPNSEVIIPILISLPPTPKKKNEFITEMNHRKSGHKEDNLPSESWLSFSMSKYSWWSGFSSNNVGTISTKEQTKKKRYSSKLFGYKSFLKPSLNCCRVHFTDQNVFLQTSLDASIFKKICIVFF